VAISTGVPNKSVAVAVSSDKLSAYVTLKQIEEVEIPADMIRAALHAAGVVFGIDGDELAVMALAPEYGARHLVASGVAAEQGKPGFVEYLFRTTRELRPQERADGSYDYRELGFVENVNEGDALCRIVPNEPGTPGKNVLGDDVEPRKLPDIKLPAGRGTRISEDGMSLVAEVSGQVDLTGKSVTVMNTLTLEKCDISTGNIDFVGSVRITGNLAQGAKVTASGNVFIGGFIENGSITCGGNATIVGGINGQTGTEVRAGGTVKCKFIQNAKVLATGDIECGAIIQSQVFSSAAVKVVGAASKVLGAHIRARNSIECVSVGTSSSNAINIMEVGNDPALIERGKSLPGEIAENEKSIGQLERLRDVLTQLKAAGRATEDHEQKLVQVEESLANYRSKRELLDAEQIEVKEEMKSSGYGWITVTGTLNPRAELRIGTEVVRVDNEMNCVKFTRKIKEGIVTVPAR
jgi:uncharacterized protein (DUF342 family)